MLLMTFDCRRTYLLRDILPFARGTDYGDNSFLAIQRQKDGVVNSYNNLLVICSDELKHIARF